MGGQLSHEVDIAAAEARFSSPWPLEEVTEESLKEYRKNGYGDDIYSSTEEYGDFGTYTLRSWLHDFVDVPRRLVGHTTPRLYLRWEADFRGKAEEAQLRAYTDLLAASLRYRQRPDEYWLNGEGNDESEQLWEALAKANFVFKSLLIPEMRAEYANFAEQHLLEATRMDDDNRRPPEFDHPTVRRWICARAHTMGWTEELFKSFEDGPHIFRERMGNHRVERIGKKYQHIALAEVTARLADNLTVCSYQDEGALRAFEYGPSGRDMKKDIDPSLLVRATQESGWSPTPVTWWTPSTPQLPVGDTELLLAWLPSEEDLCNGMDQIAVVDPKCGKWLVVRAFRHWKVPGQNRRNHADAWSRIICLVTKQGSGAALAADLLKKQRGDSSRLSGDDGINSFLGEHGWRDAKDIELSGNAHAGIHTPYAGIVESLRAEGNTEDNSVEESFTLHVPSAAVMKLLGLHLRSGKKPEYVDSSGVVRWQDPSLHTRGCGAGVISREYFLQCLAQAGLEPVWVIAGEKNVYGGQDVGLRNGFGGCLYHTTVFTMSGSDVKQFGQKTQYRPGNKEQLASLRAAG